MKKRIILGCACLLFGLTLRWVFVPGFPPGTPGTWVPIIVPPTTQNTNTTTQAAVGAAVRIGYTVATLPKALN